MNRAWTPFWLWLIVIMVAAAGLAHGASADHLSVSGELWQDLNADGLRQADEPGIGQWPVALRPASGDDLEVRTDAEGRYTFGGLEAGGYRVEVEFYGQASPWLMTSPSLQHLPPFARSLSLTDVSLTGQDFGLHAPSGLPQFIGMAWIDAIPEDFPEVHAFIRAVDCTGPVGIMPPDLDTATYGLTVLSDALKPGCGDPGDTISFTIDGRTANETAAWQPVPEGEAPLQDGRGMLTLTAGPPFAYLYATAQKINAAGELEPLYGRTVVALIDGKVCGVGLHRVWGAVLLPLPSSTQAPGCGEAGAVVSFAVDGFAVPDTLLWRPGEHEGFTFTLDASPEAATAGPAFAYYTFEIAARPAGYVGQPEQFIEAFIDGVPCGSAGGLGPASLVVAVAPEELLPGCGHDGATVSFKLNGADIAGPVAWEPGFHEGPDSSVGASSASPAVSGGNSITPPDTGDGGLKR